MADIFNKRSRVDFCYGFYFTRDVCEWGIHSLYISKGALLSSVILWICLQVRLGRGNSEKGSYFSTSWIKMLFRLPGPRTPAQHSQVFLILKKKIKNKKLKPENELRATVKHGKNLLSEKLPPPPCNYKSLDRFKSVYRLWREN